MNDEQLIMLIGAIFFHQQPEMAGKSRVEVQQISLQCAQDYVTRNKNLGEYWPQRRNMNGGGS